MRVCKASWDSSTCKTDNKLFHKSLSEIGVKSFEISSKLFVLKFCTFSSESVSRSIRGPRCSEISSRMRSPWRSMTSCVGQQRWSRCSVAAHSKQTGRSQGWQKSRSSWLGWKEQRTGRLRPPHDFSSSRSWTEWDAVRFCLLVLE